LPPGHEDPDAVPFQNTWQMLSYIVRALSFCVNHPKVRKINKKCTQFYEAKKRIMDATADFLFGD
jgi:hypothetical protein